MKSKKILCAALAAAMLAIIIPASALAYEEGDARVTIGADLDEAEIDGIYSDFGLKRGEVTEITVTNADERAYLEGVAPEGKIGSVALSCVYITILEEGAGLDITAHNINWCTAEMYTNALTTAGIADARVMVSAPFPVSGTAALTGIYKAYEEITGTDLSELAKAVGVEELIATGDLAELIGGSEATKLINELKGILDRTQTMTDAEVLGEIDSIAESFNIKLTQAQASQLLSLCRSLEKLDVDALQDRLVGIAETIDGAAKAKDKLSSFTQSVMHFFASIGEFFAGLFGKK